ncbi:MAG: glycosyltransferase [Clostridia bacterium]|nr:glycosyltransferase [Clostridia bacterium]
MTPLISIIIPIYNTAKYLSKCIDSLLDQSYKNTEIILVNDGSTDESGKICDEYAALHKNIKVIHKANAGVSQARNTGIENATGDYLCFVDGDDYVTSNYIGDMFDVAKKEAVDIVTCNQIKIWDDGRKIELFENNMQLNEYFIISGIETLADMLYGKTCFATCCCKLYKRHIFDTIRFPSISMGEDSYTMYYCFLKAKSVAHLRSPNYYYLQHAESAMHNPAYDKFYDYILLSDNFIKTVNDKYPELFLPAVNRLIENNFWVYMKMRTDTQRYSSQLNHIKRNIKKYRKYALKDKNVCFRTRMACLISYGGMKLVDFIYDIKK